MSTANHLNEKLMSMLSEISKDDAAATLNSVAGILVDKTTFFDDARWEEVLLNIFRDQVSRKRRRKADEDKSRQIAEKKLRIIELREELREHNKQLLDMMSDTTGDNDSEVDTTNVEAVEENCRSSTGVQCNGQKRLLLCKVPIKRVKVATYTEFVKHDAMPRRMLSDTTSDNDSEEDAANLNLSMSNNVLRILFTTISQSNFNDLLKRMVEAQQASNVNGQKQSERQLHARAIRKVNRCSNQECQTGFSRS